MVENLLWFLAQQRSEEDLLEALVEATHRLGFHYFGYAFVSTLPLHRPLLGFRNNYPAHWPSPDIGPDHRASDLGLAHGLRSREPVWWQMPTAAAGGAGTFGPTSGWTQSSDEGFGVVGIVTLSGIDPGIAPDDLRANETQMRWLVKLAHSALSKCVRADLLASIEALTSREIQVLQLSAVGMTCPEISAHLQIVPATAAFHIKNATRKLGVANKTAAVAHALMLGLLDAPIELRDTYQFE